MSEKYFKGAGDSFKSFNGITEEVMLQVLKRLQMARKRFRVP